MHKHRGDYHHDFFRDTVHNDHHHHNDGDYLDRNHCIQRHHFNDYHHLFNDNNINSHHGNNYNDYEQYHHEHIYDNKLNLNTHFNNF
mmetsp:Transcript_76495/g.192514  ORF Transcript_76495/g.192514 Transcript_76495/m.192514 type:complete len:87 (+) Transcript_76495:974-1234(+)